MKQGIEMRAIVVNEYGGPEVLKLDDVLLPEPGPGLVLIRVKAAGVNPADTYIRGGKYAVKPKLPYTPGTDGAGIVEAIGSDVKTVGLGDRVYLTGSLIGTYAECTLALESQVHPLPRALSFSQGAGVYVPYTTAFHALDRLARGRAGETVLVHGASGGVGIAAVQIARARKMTVIGTAGTPAGRALVEREGAHHVLDHGADGYQEELLRLTGGRGFDVIMEMLADRNLGADLRLLARYGRVVVIGCRGEALINPRDLMAREAVILAMTLWNISKSDSESAHAAIATGLENGSLRPIIGTELPLAEAAAAHRRIMEPGAHGKIVLVP
jgi:NADPH2:quinone reductase